MKLNYFYSYFYALKKIKKQGGKLQKDGWAVNDNLDLSWLNLHFLPIIKKVGGDFNCSYNKLNTLQGSPQEIGGDFYCGNNQLTTLQGVPQKINGDFICNNNQIKDCSCLYKIKVDGNIYK